MFGEGFEVILYSRKQYVYLKACSDTNVICKSSFGGIILGAADTNAAE